jgi:hypothetical protein
MASIPESEMTWTLISLDALAQPDTNLAIANEADLMAKDVTAELRTMLGGSELAVPDGYPRVSWLSVPSELIVTARKDGRMSWRGASRSGDTAATALMSHAVDSARKHGNAMMFWPEGYLADSLVVRLSLAPAGSVVIRRADSLRKKPVKFAAFTVPQPSFHVAQQIDSTPDIVYPFFANRRIAGTVIVGFVVDTTGRADRSTFQDVWPSDKPRLTGDRARYYNQFVDAVREWVIHAEFAPASVGPCPVRQMVQLPVLFHTSGDGSKRISP